MNRITPLLLILLLPYCNCRAQPSSSFAPIAVVELFTSEGCSSCPPADKLLSQIAEEAEKTNQKIFTLSFHVDYWDRLGWRDPFSNSKYSDRQHRYAEVMGLSSVYTPQAVINGSAELVGSDRPQLEAALAKALRVKTTASITLLQAVPDKNGKIALSYEAKGDLRKAEIHFAVVSKQESTEVKSGENNGRRLSHTHVVRQFVTIPAAEKGQITLDALAGSDKKNQIIIAYLQDAESLQIIAAAEAQL